MCSKWFLLFHFSFTFYSFHSIQLTAGMLMMMMILPYSKILIDAEWPGMMYPEVCWGGTDSIHNHTTKRYKITFNIRLIGEGGEKRTKMRLL